MKLNFYIKTCHSKISGTVEMTTPESKEATQKTSNPKVKVSVNHPFQKITERKEILLGSPILARTEPMIESLSTKVLSLKTGLIMTDHQIDPHSQETDSITTDHQADPPSQEKNSITTDHQVDPPSQEKGPITTDHQVDPPSQEKDLIMTDHQADLPSQEKDLIMTDHQADLPSQKKGLKTKGLLKLIPLVLLVLRMAKQEKTRTTAQVEDGYLMTIIKNKKKITTSNILISINSDLLVNQQIMR
ncbi:hypothetical protein M472_05885 [Sphingobacterium paucimobilis HER1398]|uniref:Uncharacterized protein n=1 Tax=Sphingobacterium paucimobilis HER1398 TaxID=1346330 RepID=U2HSN4_9SPHI|nr:hypothetical protein [Sphingobacterium paucimobilis]ERJ58290.1 hypothetical protein M472_05885 [Sphingobacterium paucimobilis HER1398]